ncbi:MAG: class I SAM-dependent methyltransferase [Gemmatimonadota bacterium]
MPAFKDHFSGHAPDYARFRPDYPEALFSWLAGQCPARRMAVDIGSGNGQAALPLAGRFEHVVATDPSFRQLGEAPESLWRVVALGEALPLRDRGVDLIGVAQALHWLDAQRFGSEARRVLKAGGILAAWTYRWFRMAPPYGEAVERFYARVAPWWPPERRLVEEGYAPVPLPGDPVAVPEFKMREEWALERVAGYLRTWSATKRFQADRGTDPVDVFECEVDLVTTGRTRVPVEWDLVLRVTRMS